MGVRLDTTGRKAHQRILAAFKKLDPASVAVAVATGEAEASEEDPTGSVWDRILSALVDEFLDAHLDAMDAALEYLNHLVTSPVAVDPAPFLGQAGTQTVESFVGSTPTVVGQKVAGGMDAAQALGESRDLLAASARADSYAVGRDVVATVANNDPRFTHYARKAEPDACSWCRMLETRGAVYTVDTATKTRDGQPYHKPYLMTKKDGGTALVGGYCQCDMVAEPADGHATATEFRPGRPGDKAAVRSAYKVGAKTTERAGTVNRQLEVLRAQKAAGMATDWTLTKITALEAEQMGLLGAAMSGEFRSAPVLALSVVTRHLQGKHDQKTHGHGGGGGLTAKHAQAKAAEDDLWAQVKLNNSEASAKKAKVAQGLASRMSDIPAKDMAAAVAAVDLEDALGMQLALGEVADAQAAGDRVQLSRDLDGNFYASYPDLEAPIKGWTTYDPDTPEFDAAVREGAAAGLVNKWAQTSNDHDSGSLAIQNAIRDELKVEGAAGWLPDRITDAEVVAIGRVHGPVLQSFARAMYDNTQADLAARGITDLKVYRGTGIPLGDEPKYLTGEGRTVTLRPASSWSTDWTTARMFAGYALDQGGATAVLTATVPASRVLSTPNTGIGCLSEAEVVILGGDLEVAVQRL
jgi:hypothetical protein